MRGEKPFGGTEGECKTDSKHKEEGERWRKMNETDRNKIAEELQNHWRPLNVKSTDLYIIVSGQVAPIKVNAQEALHIGSTQSEKFAASLPETFHSKIERKVKTMQDMTKVVIVHSKVIFDIETLFARLLVVGQQRGVEVTYLPVRTESYASVSHRGVRVFEKGDKTVLVKCLGVPVNCASAPDVVLVDASQMLYHVAWLIAGTVGDLTLSFGVGLSRYPPEAQKLVLFDRYYEDEPSRGRIEGLPSDAQHTTPMQTSNSEEVQQQNSPRQQPVSVSPTG